MSKRTMHRVICVVVGFALSLACGLSQADPKKANRSKSTDKKIPQVVQSDCWEIHSLGTLGGSFSMAHGLNNSGQVIGDAATAPRILDPADPPVTFVRPFISAPNGGTLTEILTPGTLFGSAKAVNNLGEVVGTTTIGRSFPISFVTDPGGVNVKTTLAFSYAQDINNVGQTLFDLYYANFRVVIGDNEQPDMQGTNLIDVAVPVANPETATITSVTLNDSGQVAVNANDSGLPLTAYRWSSYEGAIKLAPAATSSRATNMNNVGQVVGVLRLNPMEQSAIEQAFVTHRFNTSLVMLGTPGDGNEPAAINNRSQIVGTTTINGQTHGYATAPFNVHGSIDLDTLDEVTRAAWSNLRPAAINDRGQIAGTGTLNGNNLAFLLTPKSLLAYVPDNHGEHAKCNQIETPWSETGSGYWSLTRWRDMPMLQARR